MSHEAPPRAAGRVRPPRVSRRGALAALVVVALCVAAGLSAVRAQGAADRAERAAASAVALSAATARVRTDLVDAETGERGYLLTHDPGYLDPYRTGTGDLDGQLAALHRLLDGQPRARGELADIDRLSQVEREELARTIALAEQGRLSEAMTAVSSGVGRAAMDRLRSGLDTLAAAAGRLADQQRAAAQASAWHALTLTLALVGTLLLLLAVRLLGRTARSASASRAAQVRFQAAFDRAPVGMALITLTGPEPLRFQYVNDELARLAGRPVQELVGLSPGDVLHPEERQGAAAALAKLARGTVGPARERRWLRPDGSQVWLLGTATLMPHQRGRPSTCLVQFLDVTARRAAEERLTQLALHDPLTGLPNRALLMDHLDAAIARAGRHRQRVAVLFLDLDRFKDVNDRLGHDAGDELLAVVAQRLLGCLRATDTAARLGGDEFVVLCEELQGRDDAELMGARLQAAVGEPVRIRGEVLQISTSIGVAVLGHGSAGSRELLRQADTAMYAAKRSGTGLQVHTAAVHPASAPAPRPPLVDLDAVAVDDDVEALLGQEHR